MEKGMNDELSAPELKKCRINAVQKILRRHALPLDMRKYWINVLTAIQFDLPLRKI